MKKVCLVTGLLLLGWGLYAQSFEVQQLLLDWQKLQEERQILTDLKNGYTILSRGYQAIRDVCEGSFDLHKRWLDGLLAVSPSVRNYARVVEVVQLAEQQSSLYAQAWKGIRGSRLLRTSEQDMIYRQFSGLLSESGRIIETLAQVLTDGSWRASDAERLDAIDRLYEQMTGRYEATAAISNCVAVLMAARNKEETEINGLRSIYQ